LVKQRVQADENDYTWQHLQDGYKGVLIGQNDRGLKQRWLLVHSAQAEKRESITLENTLKKACRKLKSQPPNSPGKHLAVCRMLYEQPKHLKKNCRITE
jgi:transposase